MSVTEARETIEDLNEHGIDPESPGFQAALDRLEAEVLREAANNLKAKYGITNRAAGDLFRLADEIEKRHK